MTSIVTINVKTFDICFDDCYFGLINRIEIIN
jgi:hypothetical protein